MWLGSKFTLVSDSLFRSLFKFLFRYDIFISYARSDGKDYALKLRDQLRQLDFSCFLDFDELPPGNALNNTLKRAIKKSAALVIVGTERAVKSRYVELEVGEFGKTGRAIIPIDIEGTLTETPWTVIKERDIVWIDEVNVALTRGVPSPIVADSIDRLFKYTRRNTRVRAQVLATMILFVIVVAASLFMIQQKVKAANLAFAKERLASEDAEKQKIAAKNATDKANIDEARAKEALRKADKAENDARDAAKEAKKQEKLALANAERAKEEQARAEERTRYVQAQQMGAQADIARGTGNDLDRSVLLSIESLKGALTPEGYIAWERAMDLLPHPVANSGAIKMWDTKTNKLPEAMSSYRGESTSFSSDGRYVAMAGPSTGPHLRVFDLVNSKPVVEMQLEQVNYVMSVAFTPNGKWLAIGCNGHEGGQIMFWNVASFDKPSNETPKISVGGWVQHIAFSPKGNYLAVEEKVTGSVSVWSISDDTEAITVTKKDRMQQIKDGGPGTRESTLAFSPDEYYLAMALDENTVGLWDVRTGREVSRIERQTGIQTIAFSPDGRLLATLGEGVAFWKMEFGSDAQRIPVNDKSAEVELKALAISPEWLAIAGSDGARVLRTVDWKPITTLAGGENISGVIFSPDGRWLITSSKNKVIAFKTGSWKAKEVVVASANESLSLATDSNPDKGMGVSFSPDGRSLVVAIGSRLKLFEYGTWRPLNSLNHSDPVSEVFFSPEGKWLAVRTLQERHTPHSSYRRLRTYVWDTNGLQVACRTEEVSRSENAMAEPPDAKGLVCSESKTQQQLSLLSEASKWKQVLKSNELASTSQDDLWSVEVANPEIKLSFKDGKTSRQVAAFTPDGSVKDLAFSPDSRWLVVGTHNAVLLWPLKPADMIDEACNRLRRRDLTVDEWKQYFSGQKLQSTCSQKRP